MVSSLSTISPAFIVHSSFEKVTYFRQECGPSSGVGITTIAMRSMDVLPTSDACCWLRGGTRVLNMREIRAYVIIGAQYRGSYIITFGE